MIYYVLNTLGAGPSLLLLSPWTPRNDNGGVFSLSGVRTCGMEHKLEHNNTENGKAQYKKNCVFQFTQLSLIFCL